MNSNSTKRTISLAKRIDALVRGETHEDVLTACLMTCWNVATETGMKLEVAEIMRKVARRIERDEVSEWGGKQ